MKKSVLHYERPTVSRRATPVNIPLDGGTVLSLTMGVASLAFAMSCDWGFDIFLAIPIGLALGVFTGILAIRATTTIVANAESWKDMGMWLGLAAAQVGPLLILGAMAWAFGHAHGC
jgi:hypothetical protein